MSRIVKFSDAGLLAFHSMVYLASYPQELLSTRGMAASIRVSEAHLSKVLQRLAKAGLVHSSRGPKGGFQLSKKSEDISLIEIFEAIEGKYDPSKCFFETPVCKEIMCIFGELIKKIEDDINEHMIKVKLSDCKEVFK